MVWRPPIPLWETFCIKFCDSFGWFVGYLKDQTWSTDVEIPQLFSLNSRIWSSNISEWLYTFLPIGSWCLHHVSTGSRQSQDWSVKYVQCQICGIAGNRNRSFQIHQFPTYNLHLIARPQLGTMSQLCRSDPYFSKWMPFEEWLNFWNK